MSKPTIQISFDASALEKGLAHIMETAMPYKRLKGANGFTRVGRRFWRFLRSIHHDFVCGATGRIHGLDTRCLTCGRHGV